MTAIPKTKNYRDTNLLRMARGWAAVGSPISVLTQDEIISFFDDPFPIDYLDTTIAAHPNWSEFGKGKSQKAEDFFVVFIGFNLHRWLDTSGATRDRKKQVYWTLYRNQLRILGEISRNVFMSRRDRQSAQNAIDAFSEWVTDNAWRFEPGDWQLEFVKEVA